MYLRMCDAREQLIRVVRDTNYIANGPEMDGYDPIDRANAYAQSAYASLQQTMHFGSCSVFCNNPYRCIMWQISPDRSTRMSLLCTRCRESLMPDRGDPRISPAHTRECFILKMPNRQHTSMNVNNLISTSGMYNVYVFYNFVIFY